MILESIKKDQEEASKKNDRKEEHLGKTVVFGMKNQGFRVFQDMIWVVKIGGVWDLLMEEAHNTMYSIHPDNTKMYRDLKPYYYGRQWSSMLESMWSSV